MNLDKRGAAFLLVLSALVLPLAAGCSSEPTRNKLTGRLTKDGKALEFDPIFGRVEMNFIPMKGDKRPPASALPEEVASSDAAPVPPGMEAGAGPEEFIEVFSAQVLPGGDYFVDGGIPDGRYLVTVRQFKKNKDPDQPLNRQDALKGEFSIHKSPVIRDIQGSMKLDIELAKPKG